MAYLAEVTEVFHLRQTVKAKLFGVKRPVDGLWIRASQTIVDLPYSRAWYEHQLVLLELDKRGNVEVVTVAIDKLIEELCIWSIKASGFDSRIAQLNYKQQSLEYQSAKLLEREEELKRREELQTLQEKQLESLEEKANEKLAIIEKQHAALARAWEHVNYQKQQLRKG